MHLRTSSGSSLSSFHAADEYGVGEWYGNGFSSLKEHHNTIANQHRQGGTLFKCRCRIKIIRVVKQYGFDDTETLESRVLNTLMEQKVLLT